MDRVKSHPYYLLHNLGGFQSGVANSDFIEIICEFMDIREHFSETLFYPSTQNDPTLRQIQMYRGDNIKSQMA